MTGCLKLEELLVQSIENNTPQEIKDDKVFDYYDE